MVEKDKKGRLALALRPSPSPSQPSSSSSSATEASTSTPVEKGEWYIRANQGHSIELEGIEDGMRRVESVEEAGEAVHGTTGLGVWKEICESSRCLMGLGGFWVDVGRGRRESERGERA